MITFQSENVVMPDIDFNRIDVWLRQVASSYGKRITNLNYLFCDDEKILNVNRKFLDHDYFTDIITFDYSHGDKVGGDLFISLDTVFSNAEDIGEAPDKELLRVIVHGLLHLCGINDKGEGEREIMEAHENTALALLQKI